jgi:hypothetical protein
MADRSQNGRKVEMATSTKLLGDAGEHYALSQFSFAGKYAAKMPDNWQGYDLAVETGSELVKVSVKTRSESADMRYSPLFHWNHRRCCDWIVFLFQPKQGSFRSWIIPAMLAEECAMKSREWMNMPLDRELPLTRLGKPPLAEYEDNWSMEVKELAPSATEASC